MRGPAAPRPRRRAAGRRGTARPGRRPSARARAAAIRPLSSPKARYLPTSSSSAPIGEIRKTSITPDSRSRTSESAVRVTAMCWRISATTAGPKNETTLGDVGARFRVCDPGRFRDDLGRDRRGARHLLERAVLALLDGPRDDPLVDLRRQLLGEELGVVALDRVDEVVADVDHGLLAGTERLPRDRPARSRRGRSPRSRAAQSPRSRPR